MFAAKYFVETSILLSPRKTKMMLVAAPANDREEGSLIVYCLYEQGLKMTHLLANIYSPFASEYSVYH